MRRMWIGVAVVLFLGGSAFRFATSGSGDPVAVPTPPSPLPKSILPTPSPSPCAGTNLAAGASLVTASQQGEEGETFCLAPGTYRLTRPVFPKPGQSFVGRGDAVVTGAVVVAGFVPRGEYWVAQGRAPAAEPKGFCLVSDTCRHADAVFVADALMRRMPRLPIRSGQVFIDSKRRIFLADDPTAKVVEQSVAEAAFSGDTDAPPADVTIRGLVVEKFGNPAQRGAIDSRGGSGWVVEDSEIRFNHGIGVCGDDAARIRRNFVHRQGQLGLCGHGVGGVYEDNEIAYNNTAGFDWSWEAGGTKWVKATDLTIRRNYSHHNRGPGLWTDIDNDGVLYENNRVEDNAGPGIFHEVSFSAVIRNNSVTGNGLERPDQLDGAGILVSVSEDVEVYGNSVYGNGDGIGLKHVQREPGSRGARVLRNVYVHDNDVTMLSGQTGLMEFVGDKRFFTSRGIRFEGNFYRLGRNASFAWLSASRSWREWQRFGHDVTGSATVIAS